MADGALEPNQAQPVGTQLDYEELLQQLFEQLGGGVQLPGGGLVVVPKDPRRRLSVS